MRGEAERLYMLQFGAERVSKGISVANGGGSLVWEPLIGAVVITSDGPVLLETGLGAEALADPEVQEVYRESAEDYGLREDGNGPALPPLPPSGREWTWGLPGDPLTAALATVGVEVAELALAVISHLHLDHSGGVRSLAAAGVPIAIHERELEFAFSNEATLKTGYYKPDWDGVDVDWRPLDGERQIADGLWIMFTPGHTPGHLSYRVELPKSGTWILAVDAGDLGQNFTEGIPPGHCSAGRPEDTHDAHASLSRLIDETRRRDARLVPGHDQLIWNAVKHPDGGHR